MTWKYKKLFISGPLLLAWLALVAEDLVRDPSLVFVPASMVLSAVLHLFVPWALRRWLLPRPLPLYAALAAALVLSGCNYLVLRQLVTDYLVTFAIISLVALNIVLFFLAVAILTRETEEIAGA
jgi:hypothetical protein